MSDDENCAEIFDRLAEQRFCDQAEINDSVFSSKSTKKTSKKTVTVPASPESSVSDEDLQSIEVESEMVTRKNKIETLSNELVRWEKVRIDAQRNRIDATRIAKVSQKIGQLEFQIRDHETWIERNGNSFKLKKEIKDLEILIDELEQEKFSIDSRMEVATERLRKLRPYSAASDFQNNPKNSSIDNEDEYDSLAKLIAERRRLARESGEYGGDPTQTSRGVRIKNPSRTYN